MHSQTIHRRFAGARGRFAAFVVSLLALSGSGCTDHNVTAPETSEPITVDVSVSYGVSQLGVYRASLVADVRDSHGIPIDNAIVQWNLRMDEISDGNENLIVLNLTGRNTAEVEFRIDGSAKVRVTAVKGRRAAESAVSVNANRQQVYGGAHALNS